MDAREIMVLQLPKFKVEATALTGTDGIDAVGKRGGARIIYVYVMIAERISLLRCYAKSVRTDLTADEKSELRQIAAHLKGVH